MSVCLSVCLSKKNYQIFQMSEFRKMSSSFTSSFKAQFSIILFYLIDPNYLETKKILFQFSGFQVLKYLNWKLLNFLKVLFFMYSNIICFQKIPPPLLFKGTLCKISIIYGEVYGTTGSRKIVICMRFGPF